MTKRQIRNLTKALFVGCTNSRLAVKIASNLNRKRILFITYHGVSRDKEGLEAWTLVRESEFRRQMGFLKETFECLPIQEALVRNNSKSSRPGVVVTFDDGYANNLRVALPVLEELNIPATIYVTTRHVVERLLFWPDKIWMAAKRSNVSRIDLTDIAGSLRAYSLTGTGEYWQNGVLEILEDVKKTPPSEREDIVARIVDRFQKSPASGPFEMKVENNPFTPLTLDEISELSANPLVTIGAHSHCHNLLDQLPLSDARKSIVTSKEILSTASRTEIEHFAYPNGNHNPAIARVVREEGFRSAVTVQTGFFGEGGDPYRINRFVVGAPMSFPLFKAKLTGAFELARKMLQRFSSVTGSVPMQPENEGIPDRNSSGGSGVL